MLSSSRICGHACAATPKRRDTYNAERNAEIVRRRQAGDGPREIARELGLTPSVVAGVLHRAGMSTEERGRGFSKLSQEDVATIRAQCAAGRPQLTVAMDFDISQSTVSYIVNYQLCWRSAA